MLGLLVSFTSLFLLLALSNNSWYVTLWGLCCVCLLSLTTLLVGEWNYVSTSSWVAVDGISRVLVSLTLWILLIMVLASQEVKVSRNKENGFLYFVLGLGFVLLFCFCLSSTFAFYFFFEASLIPTLLLILGWGYQPERLQAGIYIIIYTLAASLPLLFGLVLMQFIHSSSNLLFNHILRGGLIEHMMLNWLAFILFSAFLVKLPMFSVHLWLPNAHVEAPVAGSIILAAILLKLGGYGILRVYQYSNFVGTESLIFLLAVGLWGGMLCSIACFRQVDFKALIAYSSIGHIALVLAGVFSESSWGWGGAVVLMVSHAFCSSALFALANYSYSNTATRSVILVGGILAVSPSLTLWWFLFSALNMACPPSINLMGEIMIFPSSMFYFGPFVLPVAIISFLAALYSIYLYTVTQHGGNPKYLNSFITYNPLTLTLLSLHWLPANFAILKAETVFF